MRPSTARQPREREPLQFFVEGLLSEATLERLLMARTKTTALRLQQRSRVSIPLRCTYRATYHRLTQTSGHVFIARLPKLRAAVTVLCERVLVC